jgi:hypothetical protein
VVRNKKVKKAMEGGGLAVSLHEKDSEVGRDL